MMTTVAIRFWRHVNKNGPIVKPELGRCWLWTGSKLPKGYGRVWDDNNKNRAAAQVAWELKRGRPFPQGKQACHHCDVPDCVRWSHIFPGTNSENQLDSANKRRHRCARLDVCLKGHSLLDENNIYHYKGKRRCRICIRQHGADYVAKRRQEGYWKSGQSHGWVLRRGK